MFFRKEKDPFENKVKCYKCYCWLDKRNAQEVPVHTRLFFGYEQGTSRYFCGAHRVPYLKARYDHGGSVGYFDEVEVDEKGNPVKKAKKGK